jgi:Zn/Cd-binding protein ZinT
MNKMTLCAAVVLTAAPLLAGQARERVRVPGRAQAASANVAQDAGYTAPKPDGSLSCSCNVLLRMTTGLQAVVKAADAGALPAAQAQQAQAQRAALTSQLSQAESHLKEARGKGYMQQEDLCGRGAGALSASWQSWQPILAQHAMDSDFYTGVKAKSPDIPNEGDENANDQGRHCNSGQWWTEDRAWFAINGREGVCKQDQYRISQLLNAAAGERGHRCFEYKLK